MFGKPKAWPPLLKVGGVGVVLGKGGWTLGAAKIRNPKAEIRTRRLA